MWQGTGERVLFALLERRKQMFTHPRLCPASLLCVFALLRLMEYVLINRMTQAQEVFGLGPGVTEPYGVEKVSDT